MLCRSSCIGGVTTAIPLRAELWLVKGSAWTFMRLQGTAGAHGSSTYLGNLAYSAMCTG